MENVTSCRATENNQPEPIEWRKAGGGGGLRYIRYVTALNNLAVKNLRLEVQTKIRTWPLLY